MSGTAGYEEVDRRGVGPFTTVRVYRRPDGTEVEALAWHRRKGHGFVDRADETSYPVRWWAPDRRGWWIAVLFMIGSACFAVGAFPPTASALGAAAGVVGAAAGGDVRTQMFDGSGHGPHIDAADQWRKVFFDFVG